MVPPDGMLHNLANSDAKFLDSVEMIRVDHGKAYTRLNRKLPYLTIMMRLAEEKTLGLSHITRQSFWTLANPKHLQVMHVA